MNYCLVDFPILTQGKVENFRVLKSKKSNLIYQRFYEMGIRKNTPIQVIGRLPFSQNVHVLVGNESLVLRQEEARCLEVSCV